MCGFHSQDGALRGGNHNNLKPNYLINSRAGQRNFGVHKGILNIHNCGCEHRWCLFWELQL